MKSIESSRTGKIGDKVAYISPFGQCYHTYVVPRDPKTEARSHVRGSFGLSSQRWGFVLTEDQRQHWVGAAQTVPSHPSLGEYAHLSGQMLWMKIDNTLRLIGREPALEPPAPVIFGPQPVGDLVAVTGEAGDARLLLNVTAATEDVMVFGQAPCSRGRMKPRRLYYIGLFQPANSGQYDITPIYTARFVPPRPGEKVFVLTCQHQNGWKGPDHLTSAILQPKPAGG
jgi:hypothetical protein